MGSIIKGIGKAIKKVVKGVVNFVKKYIVQIVVVVAVAAAIYFTAGAAAPAVAGAAAPAAPAAATTGAGMLAAPSTAAAAEVITGSATTNAILAGGAQGASATGGAIAAASTPAAAGTAASAAVPLTSGDASGATTALETGVGAAGTGLEGTFGIAQGAGSMPATELAAAQYNTEMLAANNYAETNALNAAKASNPSVNNVSQAYAQGSQAPVSEAAQHVATEAPKAMNLSADKVAAIDKELGITMKANPELFGAQQNVFQKAGSAVMGYAERHPIQTGILMQGVGGAMKAAFTPEGPEEKEFQGLATKEGKVWDGNGLVDYKDSAIASQEFKQAAGVTQPAVAPVKATATPQAELPTPSGLISPPEPATVSVAANDTDKVNKGLLGNVKITGT